MSEKIVIALGGNALQSGKGEPTAEAAEFRSLKSPMEPWKEPRQSLTRILPRSC